MNYTVVLIFSRRLILKKIGQQNRDIFQHLKSDILNIYLEYIQLCFPKAELHIYTDFNVRTSSLRKFSKFEISNDLTDGDIKNLITSYERKRKIIFFNPICTLMSNHTIKNVLSEIDKKMTCLVSHLKYQKDGLLLSINDISEMFLENNMLVIASTDFCKNKKIKFLEPVNSHETVVPVTIQDIILIKTQLAFNLAAVRELK